jgi:cytoskeletal protein CcmA (bactofilin family)
MAEGILMSFFNSRAKSPVSVGSLPDEDKSDPGLEGQGVSRLGKGTTITGTLWFGGSARIDGQVDGEITATGTLVIGETAVITTPRIKAASVIVAGKVSGDLVASEQIVIARSARVLGNLYAPALAIEAGAWFEGHCKVMRKDAGEEVLQGVEGSNDATTGGKP